jgi:TRAP-type C4-dicarboxylate transport system permease small subunit
VHQPNPTRYKKAALALIALTIVTAIFWLNSFKLEYFPPALFLFKWHPTDATPQIQCVGLVLFGAAMVCAVQAIRSRRELNRRRQYRLCAGCGYDLRASPGRCPECGAVAENPND